MENEEKLNVGVTVLMWDLVNKRFATWCCCCRGCADKYIALDKPKHMQLLDVVDNLPIKFYD